MAMAIPVLNPMPAGYVAQVADMNALSAAATFLLTKPMTHVHDGTGGYSLTGSASTAVQFTTADFDTDGMWSSGSPTLLTVQTPGFYKVRAGVNLTVAHNCYLISTTGVNNPAGSGVASPWNWQGASVMSTTGDRNSGVSGIWPIYMYALDYITLYAYPISTGTQALTNSGSYLSMELVSI